MPATFQDVHNLCLRRGEDLDASISFNTSCASIFTPTLHRMEVARRVHWLRALPLYVVVAFAPFLLAAAILTQSPKLGPWDEEQYLDAVTKIEHGDIPRTGDYIGQHTLHEEACRGFYSPYVPPPCAQPGSYDPTQFQWGGIEGASNHSFAYPLTVAVVSRAISPVLSSDDVLRRRIASTAWFSAGLVLLLHILRRLRVAPLTSIAVLGMIALLPNVLQNSIVLTNSATALVAGSAALYYALWPRNRLTVFAIALAVMELRITNLVAVATALVFLIATEFVNRDESRAWLRRSVEWSLLTVGAFLIAVFSWRILRRYLQANLSQPGSASLPATSNEPATNISQASGSDVLNLIQNTAALAQDAPVGFQRAVDSSLIFITDTLTTPTFFTIFAEATTYLNVLTLIAATLLVGSVVGGSLFQRSWSIYGRLAMSSTVGLVGGAIIILLMLRVSDGAWNFPIVPPRYGLSIVPFLAVSLALGCRTNFGRALVAGVAFALATATIVPLV